MSDLLVRALKGMEGSHQHALIRLCLRDKQANTHWHVALTGEGTTDIGSHPP